MPFKRYRTANNATATPIWAISSSATTVILTTWQWERFPSVYPYLLTIEERQNVSPFAVTKREIVEVTNRVNDTFTITRSAWTCLPNDSSNTPGTTAFSFNNPAQTVVTLAVTAETTADMQAEIATKMPTIGWLGEDYWVNKVKEIDPLTGDEVLRNLTVGTSIGSTQLLRYIDPVTRNYTEISFNDFSWILTPQSNVFTDEYILWESVSQWNALSLYSRNQSVLTTQNIWDISANNEIWYPIISSGTSSNQIILDVASKTWSPANLVIRIETDTAGVHSWTLVNANATVSVSQASISAWNNTITFPSSFSCWAIWTKVWIGISCSVNASNYYTINTIRWIATSSTFTNWTSNTSGWTFYNWITFTVNKACYLSRVVVWNTITLNSSLRLNGTTLPWTNRNDRLYNTLLTPWTTYTLDLNIATWNTFYSSTGNLNKTDGTITVTNDTVRWIEYISFIPATAKFTSSLIASDVIIKANTASWYHSLVRGFVKSNTASWVNPLVESWFVTSITGLNVWESYILSNTAWLLTTWTSWNPFRVWNSKKTNLLEAWIQWNHIQYTLENNVVYAFQWWLIQGGWWASGNTSLQWSKDWETWVNIYSITGWVAVSWFYHVQRGFIRVNTNVSPAYIF